MAFILFHDILNRDTPFLQLFDHLIGFRFFDTRVIKTLRNKHWRSNFIYIQHR